MSQAKPVIAIVPGGFCGPQVYQDVANALRGEGFTVIIPALTTTKDLSKKDSTSAEYKDFASKGVPDDVKEIQASLASELDKGSEIVIFGHSYGSLPALIALDGQTVEERKAKGLSGGIKAYAAVSGFAYTMRGKNIMGTTDDLPVMPYHTLEEGVLHMQDTAKPLFFSDLSTEEQDKAWEQVFKNHSQESFRYLPDFIISDVKIPKIYVMCEEDQVVAPAWQEMVIQMGGFDKVEKLPSGHFPFVSMPEETAKLFAEIATG
ncbi:hypothetical protein ACHAPA_009570 [Fusarium lateritium]